MPSEMMKFSFHFPGFVGLARKEAVHSLKIYFPWLKLNKIIILVVISAIFFRIRIFRALLEQMPLHRLGPPDKPLARHSLVADPADSRWPHRLLTGPVVFVLVKVESEDNLNVILRFSKVSNFFFFSHLKFIKLMA